MALPAASGVIMQLSPCQPRSLIFAIATAMPALILAASKPGGSEGSEKSTVSGFWPTNSMRVMWFLDSNVGAWTDAAWRSLQALTPKEFAVDVERLARGPQENKVGGKDV